MRNRTIFLLLTYFLISLFCGLIYVTSQQIFRSLADDPQIQIAQDVTTSLNAGADPSQLSPNQLDIKTSVAPFVIIYDKNGKAVASSGQLDKKTPVPPKGVFDQAKKYGENRFSWAPAKGVRQAAVIVKYDKGFVLVARSLKHTEERVGMIIKLVGLGWVVGIAATTAAFLLTGGLPIALPKLNLPSREKVSAIAPKKRPSSRTSKNRSKK